MIKINVIGGILGTTGYDSHTRSLANALYKIADVKLSTQLVQGWERMVNDAELNMITKPNRDSDINIIVTTPHYWKSYLGLGMNCCYCVWEGDKIPESYMEEIINPKIEYIFVPSEHTKKAIIKTFEDNKNYELAVGKIKVISHGVDMSIFKPIETKKEKFTFVCNKGWRGTYWDRGGVQYLIKAFCEEFRSNEQVELIVKLNPAYINIDVLKQAIINLNLPQDRPMVNISLDNMPYDKLVDFYNKGDVFVCPTRAEAFNIPGLEAMSCGLPTIQTDFGGQTDYMTPENSLKIDYKLEKVKEDLMYEEIQWAIPDMEQLKKHMRWCFNNQDKVKLMGEKALQDSKKLAWDNTAKRIVELLQ